MRHLSFPLVLSLAACDPWSNLRTNANVSVDGALWSPADVVARVDGVYAPLPSAGRLVRIDADAAVSEVDLDGAFLRQLVSAADDQTLVGFVERYTCADPKADVVDDCAWDELGVHPSLALVRGARVDREIPLDAAYNALSFADDGRWAIAYFDFDTLDLSESGVVSLNAVVAIDLDTGASTPVAVGFDADQVLFTYEANGAASRAVVLSQSSVAVIDLTGTLPARTTTFPLALDADAVIVPSDVALTPDGQYALIATASTSDLYALDLVNESINIVELDGVPASLTVDALHDRTWITYRTGPVAVDALDHAGFELERYELEERVSEIVLTDTLALAWGPGLRDVYRIDLNTGDQVEYRLQNPAAAASVDPAGQTGVVVTSATFGGGPAAYPGLELLDLTDDGVVPYKLEGFGVGVAFTESAAGTRLLLLQEGVDYLLSLDLGSGGMSEVSLPAPPVAIGALPGGPFYITHTTSTGLVSFLAADDALTSAGGFATLGLAEDTPVVTDDGEGE